jgi:multidrug efflux pump subunit AcrB
MKLPRLAIENYQFTIIVVTLLLVWGGISFLTMPRTEDPPLRLPGASVIVIYPGGTPADLEELIASPLEESINELDDIKRMETSMRDGIVVTSVEFTFGTNADKKFDEVVQQVNGVKVKLPQDIYSVEVLQWTSSDVVIMQLAMVSETEPFSYLEAKAEELKKSIEGVGGVKTVDLLALPAQEVRVSLDLEKMAQMNISLQQVGSAIMSNNANIPGGNIEIGQRDFGIRTSGSYKSLDEIRNTVVSSYNGRLIYLENIASVQFDYEDEKYLARYDGRRCIFLAVKQKAGYNIYSIRKGVRPVLEEYRAGLNSSTEMLTVFDQSESVDKRINGFLENILEGIVLVGMVIFLSLGFRASLIVMFAIPSSILIGLGFTDLTGFGLQQISIAGLVIALGMLVDDAIVIVQNIERIIGEGMDRKNASIFGTVQLGWPVVSATITTMLAFIPIMAMPDKAGKFIQSMPITIIYTMGASLILALTITPYLSNVFLRPPHTGGIKDRRMKLWLSRFIEGPYRKVLAYALRRPAWVLTIAVLALAGAGLLFSTLKTSFFPKAEKPQFMIRIKTSEGSSIDKANEVAMYVESVLDTLPEVKHYAANVGHGNPRIYYNMFPKLDDKSFAEIYVELKEFNVKQFDALVERLRKFFSDYPGAQINIKEFEQGAPIEAPLTIKLTGKEIPVLKRISKDVESFVRASDGPVNIDNPLNKVSTDLYFNINRDKASMLGVPVVEIDRTIRTSITGATVSKFRDNEGKEYNIVLRLPYQEKIMLEDLDRIFVTSLTGRAIPLKQLANVELKEGTGIITHFDMDRNATVTADIRKGVSLDEVIAKLDEKLRNYPWPEGYSYTFTGEKESREESFGGIFKAAIFALIAIFAILVMQFRSFIQPLIIFTAVPFAGIGASLALFLTGNSFSFTAGIGLTSLIGIVVKNSIVLVDYTNKLVEEGKDILTAVKMAGEVRFTPIILTSLTTIGGLLPLTLQGGTLWAPMGWTIIGGLLVSTMLTLLIVPVLYKLLTTK